MMPHGHLRPRILALDLDDALLRSDLSISHRTRNAVKRASEAGVTVVLASGLTPGAIDHFSRLINLHKMQGYLICNNGALILESHTGNIVHEARIEAQTALGICDLAEAEGFSIQLYEDDTKFVSRQSEYPVHKQGQARKPQIVLENFRAMVADGCHKLMIPGTPDTLASIEKIIRNYAGENVTLFTSRPYYLEIMPKATDKGTALAKVAEITGIKTEEIMAISAAMANDDDGVAEVIEKYFLPAEA